MSGDIILSDDIFQYVRRKNTRKSRTRMYSNACRRRSCMKNTEYLWHLIDKKNKYDDLFLHDIVDDGIHHSETGVS